MNVFKKTAALLVSLLLVLTTLTALSAPTADAAPWECPAGSFEDGNGKCRVPVADTVACPEKALGVPGGCYVFVEADESEPGEPRCPIGSFEDGKGKCRMPVADEVVCPKGALGVPGACYVFVAKVSGKTIGFAIR